MNCLRWMWYICLINREHGFKAKGIPAKVRKYLLRIREELRRGVLTFDYLERRTIDNIKLKPKPKK